MEYQVVEKFVSINGEGTKAGQLAVFIRFKGCNLNCSFCDTKWANEKTAKFETMTDKEIIDYVKGEGIKNITMTGGEPLLQRGIDILIDKLIEEGFYVEIETNGSVNIKDFSENKNVPSFTMDYKLPGSGMEEKMELDNFNYLTKKDTVKFVAGDKKDLIRAKEIIDKYNLIEKCNIYISPVFGKINPEEIVEFMKLNKMNGVNMQLQMHKFIWSPDKRGV